EPSLYGIHLRFKRIYPRMLVGCLVGGLITGIGGGVNASTFAFTSLLTITVFSPVALYGISIAAAFLTSMILIIISDYRTPEQRAAAKKAKETVSDEPRVIIVGDEEANQAKQWLKALGGEANVVKAEHLAETRVRVEVKDGSLVDADALRRAGLAGSVQISENVWHLVAGLEADQYATSMGHRLANTSA
ncbi:MAG: PTS sugar transporter subunit IIABC, partial [Arachnia propionica]